MDKEQLEERREQLLEDMQKLQQRMASDRQQFLQMQGAVAMIDELLKAEEEQQ